MKKIFKYNKLHAITGIPVLLAFGIPALLVACVIVGIWVFIALIMKTYKKRKQTIKDKIDEQNRA